MTNVYIEAFRRIASEPLAYSRLNALADALEALPAYQHEEVIRAVLHIPDPAEKSEEDTPC